MSDAPNPPLWYIPVGNGASSTDGQQAILKLAKDIPVPARQNIGVTLNFFPFNQWEKELFAPEKHIYDEDGRFYRYDLWNGRLSWARNKEDVADAPDAIGWPIHMRPKPGSKRWRQRHVMDVMVRGMRCRESMSRGMQDVAMCKDLAKQKLSGDHYVVKAQRCVMYFQSLSDSGLGDFAVKPEGKSGET